MKEKSPLVTVYIPTHNRAALIKRAVMTVINQTYVNIEIVVVDDGSTDNTQQVLNELAGQYNNLTVLSHERPKGACAARNLAINNAKGFFVTGLDDDDEFLPHRVSDFVTNYRGGCSFFFTTYIEVNGNETSRSRMGQSSVSWVDIKKKNYIGNQIFIERSKLSDGFQFCEEMPAWQDYDLWFRLIKEYGSAYGINNYSYLVDVSAANNRITTSPLASQGFCMFMERHKGDLSVEQIDNLKVQDLYNRRVKLSLVEMIHAAKNLYMVKKLFFLFMLIRLPKLYKGLVSLYDFLVQKPNKS